MKKWLIGVACVGMLATAAMGDLSSPATLPIAWAGETGFTMAAIDALTGWDATGLGTAYAAPNASAKFDTATDKIVIYFDSAPGSLVCTARRSDAAALAGPYSATIEESADNATWSLVRTFDGSELNGTLATFSNTLQSSTRYVKFEYVTKPTGQNFGVGSVQISSGGPAVFGVNLDKQNGFTVEQGTSAAITATALNGTETYNYTWGTTMAAGDYTAVGNVFTILATAALGNDYTATVTATDSSDPQQQAEKAVTFSVVAPAVKYGIAITPPVNGTVTTTPETQAAEGSTVTINAMPNGGFAVDVITVEDAASNPVTVTGNTFVMPTSDVTVTVTFQEAATSGNLIISQYYEGASNNKWIEIYNPGSQAIDLPGGGYRLGQWNGANREGWKTGVAPSSSIALSNSIAAGGTFLIMNNSAVLPAYAVADQMGGTAVMGFNGDDSLVLYTGATFDFANVVDAVGFTANTAADTSYVRKNTITTGVNTDFNAEDWDVFTLAAVESASATANEYLGYHSTGPVVFSVNVDKANGFTVEQGTSGTIIATAQNGTEPYGYAWDTTMAVGDYNASGDTFTILATAALGDFSATVTATDDASATAEKTVTFSVVLPAVRYGITINPSLNGSSTTVPADEAEAGQAVTIVPAPESGYAVGTITVTAADSSDVPVTGNTFTMPAQAVTIDVTFVEFTGSALFISEVADPSGTGGDRGRFVELYNAGAETIDLAAGQWYLAKQVNGGATWDNIALTGTVGAAETYVVAAYADFLTLYPTAPAPDQISGNANGSGDDGYFLYSGGNNAAGALQDSYGVINEDGSGMPWEYTDSRAVRNADVTAGNPTWTASEWTIASAVYADMTPGVHPDGPAVFSVLFTDQTEGFVVAEGVGATITASAVNGALGYTYAWTTSMNPADYGTAEGVFTVNAAAPVGSYWAEVVATDSTSATATNRINFTIAAPYAITITPPVNGAVTTDPAGQAIQGTTVTITATPDANYAVGTIQVNGGAVAVTGTTFVMPAEPVTVAVTFVFDIATLPIAENYTETMDWQTLVGWSGVSMTTYADGSMAFNASGDQLMVHFDGEPGPLTFDLRGNSTTAGTAPMQFDVEESADGVNWTVVDSLDDTEVSTTVASFGPFALQAATRYVRWNYVNKFAFNLALNNVAIGASGPFLTYEGSTTIQMGGSFALTFTLNGGTASGWEYTLESAERTEIDSGSANAFNWTPTSAGTYYLTMTALDEASNPIASREVTLTVTPVDPGQPAVIISGSLSGTVGVQMSLAVSLTNGTLTGDMWYIDLVDPDALADTTYGFDGSTFTLTPTKTGTYVLTITAVTETGNVSNTVNLVISGGGGELPNITEFEVPAGATASATLATTTVGKTYKLQYTTNLLAVPVVWQDADTQAGTGGEIILQDGDPADMARYYRVTEN